MLRDVGIEGVQVRIGGAAFDQSEVGVGSVGLEERLQKRYHTIGDKY